MRCEYRSFASDVVGRICENTVSQLYNGRDRKVGTAQSSNFTKSNQNLQEEIQGDQITGLWLLIVLALLSADVVMIMLYSGSSNLKP